MAVNGVPWRKRMVPSRNRACVGSGSPKRSSFAAGGAAFGSAAGSALCSRARQARPTINATAAAGFIMNGSPWEKHASGLVQARARSTDVARSASPS